MQSFFDGFGKYPISALCTIFRNFISAKHLALLGIWQSLILNALQGLPIATFYERITFKRAQIIGKITQATLLCFPLFLFPAYAGSFYLEISIEDAYQIAVEQNPAIDARRAQKEMAMGVKQQTLQAFLPAVSFDTMYLRFDSSIISDVPVPVAALPPSPVPITIERMDSGPVDANLFGFQAVQPLVQVGAWKARQQADRHARGAELALGRGERELALNLIEAYYGAVVAWQRLDAEQAALAAADETLRLVESSFDEGLVAPVDVYAARAQRFEFKSRVSEAEGGLATAMAQLGRVMGMDEDVRLDLVDDIPDPPRHLPGLPDSRRHIDQRRDLLAQQEIVAAARVGVDRANAAFLPTVNLLGRYQWTDTDDFFGTAHDLWAVAVHLQWTIFSGMSRSGTVSEARAKEREQEARLREMRQEARVDAISSRARWQAAMASWEYSQMATENAAMALDQTRGRYREGIDGIAELLRAQAEDLKARSLNLNARYEAVLAAHQYRLQGLAIHPMEEWK